MARDKIKEKYGRESQLLNRMHEEMVKARTDDIFREKRARYLGAKEMLECTIGKEIGTDIVLVLDHGENSRNDHGV